MDYGCIVLCNKLASASWWILVEDMDRYGAEEYGVSFFDRLTEYKLTSRHIRNSFDTKLYQIHIGCPVNMI